MTSLGDLFRFPENVGRVVVADSASRTVAEESAWRSRLIVLSGPLTAGRTVQFPSKPGGDWVLWNLTTGGFAVTLTGPAGATVTIPNGATAFVVCDGVDMKLVSSSSSGAPLDAEYIVATANGTLTNERVATSTSTITVDAATAGQFKWNVAAVPLNLLGNAGGANGDVLYHNGTNWIRLAAGTNGHVLTLAGGVPSWAAGAGGFTAGTDLRGSSSSQKVQTITGSTDTPSTSTLALILGSVRFRNDVALDVEIVKEAPQTDAATYSLTIGGQPAYPTASGGNRKPGDLNLEVKSPTNGGTTYAKLNLKNATNTIAWVENDKFVAAYPLCIGDPSSGAYEIVQRVEAQTTTGALTTAATVTPPSSSACMVMATVIGTKSDGSDSYFIDLQRSLTKDGGGTITWKAATRTANEDIDVGASCLADITASGGNVIVQVQGINPDTWNWIVIVRQTIRLWSY